MRIGLTKQLPSLAFIALWIACGCADAKAAPQPSPITITLDATNPGAVIPPDFMGLSFEVIQLLPDTNGVHYFRPDNQPLVNLFRTLGIRHLRIGGSTADRNAKQLPDEADLDSFFAFAKAVDVKVIYCLRLHGGDPQADIQTAKYIMDHYAAQMDCFSIGQESSGYPKPYSYLDYQGDWKEFADALIAAVPGIKFCGPEIHNNGEWARRFMEDFGRSNQVALITEHLYPGNAPRKVATPEIGRDMMLTDDLTMTNSFPLAYEKLYNSFVPECISNGLPYRLDEVNSFFGGGRRDVSDTFASALWGLDYSWWWATHDAAGLDFHTGDTVAFGARLVPSSYAAYYTATNGYDIHPLAYGLKAFVMGSQGRLVPLTISNPDHLNLNAYAVLGGDKNLYLTIINKEHGTNARDAEISINQNSAGFMQGQAMFLTVSNNDVAATSGETLGGAEIKNDGSWNGKWQNLDVPLTDNLDNGVFYLKIPSASAAVVKLTPK